METDSHKELLLTAIAVLGPLVELSWFRPSWGEAKRHLLYQLQLARQHTAQGRLREAQEALDVVVAIIPFATPFQYLPDGTSRPSR